jgi:hypothetical protein
VAHWRATFRRADEAAARSALDGVLMAAFDRSGRCTSLRQWWHVGDPEAPG